MGNHRVQTALESIGSWDLWGGETADDGSGFAPTGTCPSCGYTGTMDPPVSLMPAPKKLDQSMAAAEFYDSYSDLRDALSDAVSGMVGQGQYAYVVDFGDGWVIWTSDSDDYFRSDYTVGPSGTISLSNKVAVHRVFVPVAP